MLKGQQLLFIIWNPTPTMPSVLEVYLGWVLEGESRENKWMQLIWQDILRKGEVARD